MRLIKLPTWRNTIGRVPDVKRIQKEDFEGEMQDAVDKLAFPLNSFMEQVKAVLDKNVDFKNLNQEPIILETTVDVNGNPTVETKYRSNLRTKVLGHTCINAFNLTNTAAYPTGQPFISFIQNGNIITVLNVKGLQANQKYRLIVLSIGQ